MRPLLLTLFLPLSALAQDKSPSTATALSVVVPGGGQCYSGETVKGGAILGVAAAGAVVAVTAWTRVECTSFGCASEFSEYYEVNETQFAVGLGIAGAAWLFGVVDASGSARRANRRAQVSLAPRPDGGATIALRIGL